MHFKQILSRFFCLITEVVVGCDLLQNGNFTCLDNCPYRYPKSGVFSISVSSANICTKEELKFTHEHTTVDCKYIQGKLWVYIVVAVINTTLLVLTKFLKAWLLLLFQVELFSWTEFYQVCFNNSVVCILLIVNQMQKRIFFCILSGSNKYLLD